MLETTQSNDGTAQRKFVQGGYHINPGTCVKRNYILSKTTHRASQHWGTHKASAVLQSLSKSFDSHAPPWGLLLDRPPFSALCTHPNKFCCWPSLESRNGHIFLCCHGDSSCSAHCPPCFAFLKSPEDLFPSNIFEILTLKTRPSNLFEVFKSQNPETLKPYGEIPNSMVRRTWPVFIYPKFLNSNQTS